MASPDFSVIIPAYNRAHVLPRAINSVLNQTYRNFEIVVVDDGSSDCTESRIREYKDPRVRGLKHETNLGQNCALNTGIDAAQGEFISFLDSDDEWLPSLLDRVLEKFHSDRDLGCVYVGYGVKEPTGNTTAPLGLSLEGYIYKEALELCGITPPSMLTVKKSCFEVVGTFEPGIVGSQDDIMFLALAKKFKVGVVNEVLATMHYDAGGRVSQDPLHTAQGYYYLRNKFADDILEYCGKKAMAEHYVDSAMLFLDAGEKRMALKAFRKSLTRGDLIKALTCMAGSLWTLAYQQAAASVSRRNTATH